MAMESSLAAMGLPTGRVDGLVNSYTKRALCAYRDLHGLPASRKLAGSALMADISSATELPLLPKKLFGVKALVSLTCQTAYITNNAGHIVRVLPVSTGKDNGYHETRTGFKRVYYRVNAWQASTCSPNRTAGRACTDRSTSTAASRSTGCASPCARSRNRTGVCAHGPRTRIGCGSD